MVVALLMKYDDSNEIHSYVETVNSLKKLKFLFLSTKKYLFWSRKNGDVSNKAIKSLSFQSLT